MDMTCLCHKLPRGKLCVSCWAAVGYPGAINGDTGERNWTPFADAPPRVLPPPKPNCSVPTCERIAAARGLCYMHLESQRVRAIREAIRTA